MGTRLVAWALTYLVIGASCASRIQEVEPGALTEVRRAIEGSLSLDDHALITNAHSEFAERCMRAKGWDFRTGRTSAAEIMALRGPFSDFDTWTFEDVRVARERGYGVRESLAQRLEVIAKEKQAASRMSDPTKMTRELARAFQLDLNGSESERITIIELDGSTASMLAGGCSGQARKAIWGDVARWMRFQDIRAHANSKIWKLTIANSHVKRARRSWESCMRRRGYEFEDPEQAVEKAYEVDRKNPQQEMAIAIADTECKRQSRLGKAFAGTYSVVGKKVLRDHASALIAFRELEAKAIERAKKLILPDS